MQKLCLSSLLYPKITQELFSRQSFVFKSVTLNWVSCKRVKSLRNWCVVSPLRGNKVRFTEIESHTIFVWLFCFNEDALCLCTVSVLLSLVYSSYTFIENPTTSRFHFCDLCNLFFYFCKPLIQEWFTFARWNYFIGVLPLAELNLS